MKAVEIDPLSAAQHGQLAQEYWAARQYDEAITTATRALELEQRSEIAAALG